MTIHPSWPTRSWEVQAILKDLKTQTRIPIRPQPWFATLEDKKHVMDNPSDHCPFQVGDRLWVRETWKFSPMGDGTAVIHYVDGTSHGVSVPDNFKQLVHNNWRPSIHMPQWASRITLEITNIRVEKLQEISEEDIKAEGIRPNLNGAETRYPEICKIQSRGFFEDRWNSKYGKTYPWESNPGVFVIEHRRI